MVPTPGTVLSAAFLLFSGYNVLCGTYDHMKMCNRPASLAMGFVGLVGAVCIAYLDRTTSSDAFERSWRGRGAQVLSLARCSRVSQWLGPGHSTTLPWTAAPRNWRIATGSIVAHARPEVDARPVPTVSMPVGRQYQYELKCPNSGGQVQPMATEKKRSQSMDRQRTARQEALCRECNQWFKSPEACMDHFSLDRKQRDSQESDRTYV